jgi:UPF0755 protein
LDLAAPTPAWFLRLILVKKKGGRFLLTFKKPFLAALSLLLMMASIVGGGGYILFRGNDRLKPIQIYFPKGMSASAMGSLLADRSVISDSFSFVFFAAILRKGARLQWGEYAFNPHFSLYDVLTTLTEGSPIQRRVTIPEGLTSAQIAHVLNHTDGLMGAVKAESIPEGSLLPETYYYHYGDEKQAIIHRMKQAAKTRFHQQWGGSDHGSLTLDQAIILASIVEKETGLPSERSRIARVFLNRLALGMALQSDVTVLYGKNKGRPVGQEDRTLSKDDLRTDHPFNTYLYVGLPPSPICHPGAASLNAVLNPYDSKDLYFVADGTGGHVFSETLAQHQKNHQAWRRIRRERQNSGL